MITVQHHKERGWGVGGGIDTKRDPADDAALLPRGPASLQRLIFSRTLALFISTFNWTFRALPLPLTYLTQGRGAPFILAPLPVTHYSPKGNRGKGSRPFSDNLVRSDLSFLLQSERMFREHTFSLLSLFRGCRRKVLYPRMASLEPQELRPKAQ